MVVLAVGVVIFSVALLLAQCHRLCPLECGPSGEALLWMSGELGASGQPELNFGTFTSCDPGDPSPHTQQYTGEQILLL